MPSQAPVSRPWLSILLPVYNTAPYLEECLASIFGQIGDGVEVIAYDDASTDESPRILAQWQTRHPQRLQVYRHERNQGVSAARNHLLAAATGARIWFVDSDDLMVAGAVARLRAVVEEHDPDLVSCNYQDKRVRHRLKHRLFGVPVRQAYRGPVRQLSDSRELLVRGTYAAGAMYLWIRVFRRSCFPKTDCFVTGRDFEDIEAMPRLLLRTRTHYHEPSVWMLYRERPGSILRAIDARRALDLGFAFSGLEGEFTAAIQTMDTVTKRAVSIFCIRTLQSATRHLARNDRALFRQHRAALRQQLERVSPHSVAALARNYSLRPNRWNRALRMLAWHHHPEWAYRLGL